MEAYLIKSTACLLLFYGFYRLLLERQSNHHFKRAYLLVTLLGGILLPLIKIPVIVPRASAAITVADRFLLGSDTLSPTAAPASSPWDWTTVLYVVGLLLFGTLFFRSLARLIGKILHHTKEHARYHTRVLIEVPETPHTFFRYLFLHDEAYRSGRIPDSVIAHEEVHIRQRHSADLFLAELLCLVFWFHPLVYLYRSAIRLNHEFLADREVLRGGAEPQAYQHTLLEFTATNRNQPAFIHAINYSSIKKRIVIMKSNTPNRRKGLVTALLVPVAAMALYGFTSRTVVYQSPLDRPEPEVTEMESTLIAPIELPAMVIVGYSQKGKVRAAQDGASRSEMREYEKLASKYNRMIASGYIRIRTEEVDRMAEIYDRMNEKQRADAEPFPDFPDPPPAPEPVGGAGPVPPVAPEPHPPLSPRPPHAIKEAHAAHPANGARPAMPAHGAHPAPVAALPSPPSVGAASAPPPPPPAPVPDPETHLRELADRGATFLYKGTSISGDAAIELFRSGKIDYINVRHEREDETVVHLSE